MARKVFFSFHYENDNWRASQVRNIWVVEWNEPVSDNDWEKIKWDDERIKEWINDQLEWRSCAIVLIWKETAWRKWINYEIKESWNKGKWVVWIYIHNLKDKDGNQTQKWENPFDRFNISGIKLSDIVKAYNPPYKASKDVYNYIAENIQNWVEEAIKIRNQYSH